MKYFLLLLLIFTSKSAFATEYYYWGEGGFGGADELGGVELGLNFGRDREIYSLYFGGYGFLRPTTHEEYEDDLIRLSEVGLLYGYQLPKQFTNVYGQVGLSTVSFSNETCRFIEVSATDSERVYSLNCEEDIERVIGIPIRLNARVGKVTGVGLSFRANLNTVRPYVAVSLISSLGKFTQW